MPTDSPWQLRACNNSMCGSQQDQSYFRAIPRMFFYAGNESRDFVKHVNNKEVEAMGLLAAAKTKDLRNHDAAAEAQELPRTQFPSTAYDAGLVKHWLELSNKIDSESSEIDDECYSQEGERGLLDNTVIIEGMKLVDCETFEIISRTTQMEHIALSYVWRLANDDMVPLTSPILRESEAQLTRKFLPPFIPRVVHNAITVVKDTGFRYLWVDQYCIDQSATAEEIGSHVSKMDLIYSSARLTIIAASSRGALPGVGTTRRIPQKTLIFKNPHGAKLNSPEDELTFFTTSPSIDTTIVDSTWSSRGWCFQEATLSPRRLFFLDHEALFEAYGMQCSDSYPDLCYEPDDPQRILGALRLPFSLGTHSWDALLRENEDESLYDLDDPRGRFLAAWIAFVKLLLEYIVRETTLDADVCNAFKGVMKVFTRRSENLQFLGGLPVFSFYRPQPEHSASSGLSELSESSESSETDSSTPTELQGSYEEEVEAEELEEFGKKAFVNCLGWKIYSRQVHRRRIEFPSWSWTGWKVYEDIMDYRAFHNFNFLGEPDLELWAVESTNGRVVDFDEAPAWFSHGSDEPMFLIGEATMIPMEAFLLRHEFSRLSRKSRVQQLKSSASSLWKTAVLRTRYLKIKPTLPANIPYNISTAVRGALLRVFWLFKWSKCYDVDTWRVGFHLTSPEFSELSNEEQEKEVVRRVEDGRWSCLLLDESQDPYGGAAFLIVSWEQEDGCELHCYHDRELRTCYRVGMGTTSNAGHACRLFTEDHPGLPAVRFRLG